MKRTTLKAFIKAMLMVVLPAAATAQVTENFNSRENVTVPQVRSYLQTKCWQFVDFDTDPNHWNPGIEGDAAMISSPYSNPNIQMGIYTPILEINTNLSIKFNYTFNNGNGQGNNQYLRIYLTDGSNTKLTLLDSINFEGRKGDFIYNYNKTFTQLTPGNFKLFFNYGGTGLATRIAIDKLNISENLAFTDGCDQAPVAINDTIIGTTSLTASGAILLNDYDADNDSFTPYIISPPGNGIINLHSDNTFTFTPNNGFTGSTVTFTYRVCEDRPNGLCSNEAIVTIKFPAASTLPVSLVDFRGIYKGDGMVNISWTTNFETNSDRFQVERSFDGTSWKTAGTIAAAGSSTIERTYSFTDNVGKNTANKKDLYYRLRQFDKDGRSTLSRILVVRVYNTKAVRMLSVTPNPAKTDINVNLQLNEHAVASIRIVNNNGTEVQRKTIKLNEGTHSILMAGSSNLRPGLYILEIIINSKERMMVKLIKE